MRSLQPGLQVSSPHRCIGRHRYSHTLADLCVYAMVGYSVTCRPFGYIAYEKEHQMIA
jgi:hypothetical protein